MEMSNVDNLILYNVFIYLLEVGNSNVQSLGIDIVLAYNNLNPLSSPTWDEADVQWCSWILTCSKY